MTSPDCARQAITVRDLLGIGCNMLGGGESRLDVEILVGHVLQRSRAWLYTHDDEALGAESVAAAETLLQRRQYGEPVAYLIGEREFWSLCLKVTPDTLVPRPETELLVELALELGPVSGPCRVVDLGTGSGAIALAVASERPGWRLLAIDASAAALVVARENRQRLQLTNVDFHQGDWLQGLDEEQFDLLLANPPYVSSDDPVLASDDLRFEPETALAAGPDGLQDLRKIISAAPSHLCQGGWLVLEHGAGQGVPVRDLLIRQGFTAVATHVDLAGIDRVTLGRR